MGRFSSRAIDHFNALLGMLLAGFLALTIWVVTSIGFPSLEGLQAGWLLVNGVATTVMTLLLYLGLARGPVSVVAPIVMAHPVLVVLYYAFWSDHQLALIQLVAIAITITGTVVVARYATEESSGDDGGSSGLRTTIFIALGSSVAYALLIVAGQAAAETHGQTHTLWMGRFISILFLLMLFCIRRKSPVIPLRWWPYLCVQGLLDAGGYIALFAGSYGPGKEVVTVVAATFGAVTVLLARIILKEQIKAAQWLGMAFVLGGVVVLSSS